MRKLLDAAGELIADPGPALAVPGETEPVDLPAAWDQAPTLAIEFPSFADGRGLSLAVLLRTRLGYQGRLRATGDVILDLLHYMRRCGFDEFELREDQDVAACRAALQRGRKYYQASVTDPTPAYRSAAG